MVMSGTTRQTRPERIDEVYRHWVPVQYAMSAVPVPSLIALRLTDIGRCVGQRRQPEAESSDGTATLNGAAAGAPAAPGSPRNTGMPGAMRHHRPPTAAHAAAEAHPVVASANTFALSSTSRDIPRIVCHANSSGWYLLIEVDSVLKIAHSLIDRGIPVTPKRAVPRTPVLMRARCALYRWHRIRAQLGHLGTQRPWLGQDVVDIITQRPRVVVDRRVTHRRRPMP